MLGCLVANCRPRRLVVTLPDAAPRSAAPKFKNFLLRYKTRAQKPRFCARNARKRGGRRPKKHKNLDFVLETPENGGAKAEKAQKPRFCARNARKRGFRRPKKHKNPDFVLETPENGGFEGQKSTKTSILCSKRPKTRVPKAKKVQKPRFCA